MRKYLAIFFLFTLYIPGILAQGEIDNQDEYFYQDERTWSGHIRTDGIGFSYRYAKRIDGFKKTIYLIEVDHIKDKREKKVPSATYKTFVYGKLNYFYALKGGVGLQKEIFSKQDVGSVSIRYFYNFGASIGILKPIYYEVQNLDAEKEIVKFEETAHLPITQFYGKASYLKGIEETTIIPGVFGKFGLSFEYSKQHTKFTALEIGFMLDAYMKRVPIMYNYNPQEYQFLFPSMFIAFRFGKIIDSQFKNNVNKIDKVLSD